MNRRKFLKTLSVGATAVVVAPKVLAGTINAPTAGGYPAIETSVSSTLDGVDQGSTITCSDASIYKYAYTVGIDCASGSDRAVVTLLRHNGKTIEQVNVLAKGRAYNAGDVPGDWTDYQDA